VSGGAYDEPLNNLIHLLSRISGSNQEILVPGVHDSVRPVSDDEKEMYEKLVKMAMGDGVDTAVMTKKLMSRWRFPTLTIHKYVIYHFNVVHYICYLNAVIKFYMYGKCQYGACLNIFIVDRL
jgi:hypothetical protein